MKEDGDIGQLQMNFSRQCEAIGDFAGLDEGLVKPEILKLTVFVENGVVLLKGNSIKPFLYKLPISHLVLVDRHVAPVSTIILHKDSSE